MLEDMIDSRLWVLLKYQLCLSRISLLFLLLLVILGEKKHSFIKNDSATAVKQHIFSKFCGEKNFNHFVSLSCFFFSRIKIILFLVEYVF